ncbi:unnamed protein product, partial [Meganyctiphanes norvegica]
MYFPLSLQCSEGGDGIDDVNSKVFYGSDGVRRRHLKRNPKLPRHSYHEGLAPDSYLLTTVLIHSLKHGSGQRCNEPQCQFCSKAGQCGLQHIYNLKTSDQNDINERPNSSINFDIPKSTQSLSSNSMNLEIPKYNHSISEESEGKGNEEGRAMLFQ